MKRQESERKGRKGEVGNRGGREGEKERERDECDPRFDGMGIRSSLFSATICAGYFDSLRGHPK